MSKLAPFYLNVVLVNEIWQPCWDDNFIGSNKRGRAYKMREEFYLDCVQVSPKWARHHFKTIKIENKWHNKIKRKKKNLKTLLSI